MMNTTALRAFAHPSAFSRQLSVLKDLLWDNPVLVKEFRTRMRGARAYWVMLVYVLLLTLVVGITYLNWYSQTSSGGVSHQAASTTGRLLFQILFSFQAGLVALITPAITAGAVTIEREQQTYQMLASCVLRPQQIILGKLLAAVAFVALLLTSSLPLVSLSFLLGGVSPGEVFGTYVSLALSAFVFGSIGILCSAALRATAAATVTTYTAVILLFFLTLSPGVSPVSDAPFRSVNAATAIFHSVDMEIFFRDHLPSWFVGVTLNLLMGLLFANLAMTKLEYFEDRRALAVRGFATALWTVFLLYLIGFEYGLDAPFWGTRSQTQRGDVETMATIALGLLLLVLPIFTTGEWEPLRDEERGIRDEGSGLSSSLAFLRGMLPHAAFRAELPSGAPLMGLWLAIAGTIVVGGFAAMGKLALFPVDTLPLLFLSFTVLAAFTGLGNFLSVAFQDRKAAMVLSYLIIAALCLLPLFGFMTWEASGRSGIPQLSWQFLYLTPFLAFMEMTAARGSFWSSNPPMLFQQTPFWLVTSVIYGVMAVLFFWLTLSRIEKNAAAVSRRLDRQREAELTAVAGLPE